MTSDLLYTINRLRGLEEIHVAYAVATNMPFVSFNEETKGHRVWIFTSMDEVRNFAAQYKEQKILFKGVCVKRESLQNFYFDLDTMGVNEIAFCENGETYCLELGKLVKLPDYSSLPENKRPLMNPQLQLATVYFFQKIRRQDADVESDVLEALAGQMYSQLASARLLMTVEMIPTGNGKGKVNMPYITDKNGNKFQPVFSDHAQYLKHTKKNKPSENTRVLVVGVEEMRKHILDDCQGYMLNPDGYCHPINKAQLDFVIERFCKQA